MSDIHLKAGETIPGVDPTARLAQFLGEIIDRGLQIDACIITGDLTDDGSAASYRTLRALLNSCPWPIRVVPGNHDDIDCGRENLGPEYWPDEDVWEWQIDGGASVLGTSSVVPGFDHGEFSNTTLDALTKILSSRENERPWVLACHHPPLDIGHWWMDGQSVLKGQDQLLDIVDSAGALAVLCGHVHVPSVVHRRGKTPIVVGPSVGHEVLFDEKPRPLRFRKGSPSAFLHVLSEQDFTTVEVTSGGPTHLVGGNPWADVVTRTNSRHPAPK